MYCSNCGKENNDGVAFCSHCGKSPNGVAINYRQISTDWMKWTMGVVWGCFPWISVAMFWLIVIGSMMGGAKTAQDLYVFGGGIGAMVFGGLIGLLSGFIIAVWASGIVATLLEINKNLQRLADKEKAEG